MTRKCGREVEGIYALLLGTSYRGWAVAMWHLMLSLKGCCPLSEGYLSRG